MKARIRKFIEHPTTFSDGLELLRQINYPAEKIAYLRKASRKKKLISTLKKLISYKEKTRHNPSKKLSSPIQERGKTLPPVIITLKSRAKKLHKEHSFHHAMLQAAGDNEERYIHADKIMRTILPRLDDIYKAIRTFHNRGVVPVDKESASQKGADDVKRLYGTLYPQISRLKRRLKTPKSIRDKNSLEKKLKEKTDEANEIKIKYDFI